jgi:hypothetical protein
VGTKRRGGWFKTGFVLAAIALGGMFADSLVKLAMAASPAGVCAVFWGGGPAGNLKEMTFQEESCDGSGHMSVVRTGKCFYNGNTGSCKCYLPDLVTETAAPDGWTCDLQISTCVGTCCNGCPTGGTCTGVCHWQQTYDDNKPFNDPTAFTTTLTGNTCSSGCNCIGTAPAGYGWGSADVPCGHGSPPGPCDGHGGNADGDSCCADVDCDDNDATKCAPDQCNPLPPPVCSGNCTYTSVGSPGSYGWELTDATCTAGLSNCSCPTSPGGNCPTSGGLHTSLACGSAGGPCTPTPCSGVCKYRAYSLGDGKFGWEHDSGDPDTCTAGAANCGCPSAPGGDCPINADDKKSVACGSSSVACRQPACSGHGGDADKDGCCKDKDVDDDDASVCEATCKGTYIRCQKCKKPDPQNVGGPEIACDPDSGTDAEKAACRCTPCTSSGSQNDDCRCSNVTNGDKDKDGCCDVVDRYPLDPTRGCECCDFEQAWLDGGGAELKAQWARIFGVPSARSSSATPAAFGWMKYRQGSTEQGFISYNTSSQAWDVTGPTGDPDPLFFSVSWSSWLGYGLPTTSLTIPVTVTQIQGLLMSSGFTGAAGASATFSSVELYRQWVRIALIWLMAVKLIGILFQEFRV